MRPTEAAGHSLLYKIAHPQSFGRFGQHSRRWRGPRRRSPSRSESGTRRGLSRATMRKSRMPILLTRDGEAPVVQEPHVTNQDGPMTMATVTNLAKVRKERLHVLADML